jgi:two-component system, OmpR family, response regulator
MNGCKMCILLVEDEQPVREVVAEALTDEGFEVYEAKTGDEAACLINEPSKLFSLLLTDVDLPGGRDGVSLARLMHKVHPTLPVIFITGRPDKLGPLTQKETLLAKPFSFQKLMQTVRTSLNEERARPPAVADLQARTA